MWSQSRFGSARFTPVSSSTVAWASNVSPAAFGSSVAWVSSATTEIGWVVSSASSDSRRATASADVSPPMSTPATVAPRGTLSPVANEATTYAAHRTRTIPPTIASRRGQRRRRSSGVNTSNGEGARSLDGTRPAWIVLDAAAADVVTGANPVAAWASTTGGRTTVGSGGVCWATCGAARPAAQRQPAAPTAPAPRRGARQPRSPPWRPPRAAGPRSCLLRRATRQARPRAPARAPAPLRPRAPAPLRDPCGPPPRLVRARSASGSGSASVSASSGRTAVTASGLDDGAGSEVAAGASTGDSADGRCRVLSRFVARQHRL